MSEIIGKVESISEKKIYQRTLRPDLEKVILEISSDDNQKVFFEVRDSCIKLLEYENIKVGDTVEVKYTFQGSKNGDIIYNNIVVTTIKLLKNNLDGVRSI